jgi:hypothetical protein
MSMTSVRRRASVALGFACAVASLAVGVAACRGGDRIHRNAADAAVTKGSVPPDPTFGPAAIDAAIRAAWQKEGIVPAGPVDDAGFLRRAWLDIGGTLPPPGAVAAFLADPAPDKRAKAIEALLASPHYADRWTDAWDEVLVGQARSPLVDRGAFRRWLHARFEANTPWNKLVYELLTATGRNSVGGRRDTLEGPAADAGEEADEGVNGAVNWILKYGRSPQDLPAAASRVFLGVQIQCAQCHDHKTEKWTQDDFRSFAACFAGVQAVPAGEKVKGGVRAVEVRDRDRPRRIKAKNPDREALQAIAAATPKALDGSDLSGSENRRQALAAWMTSPENPWFARAIVNRVWAALLGRGFVDPIDDLRPGNPGVLPELQERLARDFVARGYDLKQLIRTICATEVYQRAAAPAQGPGGEPARDELWPRHRLRPMSPDILLNALIAATGLDPVIERVAGERRDQIRSQMRAGFGFLFDIDEESAEDDYEGTIPQALLLLNGAIPAVGVSGSIPGTALARVLDGPGADAQKIEALYLRALSRRPSAAEIERWARYVNEPRDAVRTDPPPEAPQGRGGGGRMGRTDLPARIGKQLHARPGTARQQAYEDLFWALLNSSEFFFNH